MKFKINGSSSKGNNIVIENTLMLDCGLSYSRICPSLKNVKYVFISHVHEDHLKPSTIKKMAYNHPQLRYITGSKEVVKTLYMCGVRMDRIWLLKANKWYKTGDFKLRLEHLTHDADNYCIKWEYNGEFGIYITDTANVDNIKAKDYNLYLIESNYQEDVLKKHIEECEDKNKLYYLNRVPRTHLSYTQANDFLIENMGKNSEFMYIHKSSYNFIEE